MYLTPYFSKNWQLSMDYCIDTFSGSKPFSEPELKGLRVSINFKHLTVRWSYLIYSGLSKYRCKNPRDEWRITSVSDLTTNIKYRIPLLDIEEQYLVSKTKVSRYLFSALKLLRQWDSWKLWTFSTLLIVIRWLHYN